MINNDNDLLTKIKGSIAISSDQYDILEFFCILRWISDLEGSKTVDPAIGYLSHSYSGV